MIEKLNERITIEKSTVVTDKVGNHRNTWEEYFTCFAYASTYEAQEKDGEVTAEQKSVVFTVRWCSETRGLTSTGYHTIEEPVFGDAYVKKENYDLMEVVILNLGEPENEADCGILNLLNTLFSPTVLPDEKKRVLSEKYNIAMTAELESEVQRMCNLGTALENKGVDKGVDLMAKLVDMLMEANRYADVKRVAKDPEYRDKLMKEYKLVPQMV